MAYLYDTLIKEFGKREVARTKVPNYISDNIKYEIRPYQEESFKVSIRATSYCQEC